MDKPKIASGCPYRVTLEPGKTYFYCSCGLSRAQPFCDGSHQGTSFSPLEFHVDKQQTLWYLCGCKRNDPRSGPYCDGSHIHLDW